MSAGKTNDVSSSSEMEIMSSASVDAISCARREAEERGRELHLFQLRRWFIFDRRAPDIPHTLRVRGMHALNLYSHSHSFHLIHTDSWL